MENSECYVLAYHFCNSQNYFLGQKTLNRATQHILSRPDFVIFNFVKRTLDLCLHPSLYCLLFWLVPVWQCWDRCSHPQERKLLWLAAPLDLCKRSNCIFFFSWPSVPTFPQKRGLTCNSFNVFFCCFFFPRCLWLMLVECLYVFPCQWNYRPDHCMYGSNCKGAEEEGVSILHGNRGVYHDDKQPTFKALYEVIRDVSVLFWWRMSFHFSVYYSFNQVTQIAFTADQVEYTHQSETAKVLWPVLFYREGLNNPSYQKSYQKIRKSDKSLLCSSEGRSDWMEFFLLAQHPWFTNTQ